MSQEQPKNPLHGLKLQDILIALVDKYDWPALSKKVEIRCFYNDPSIKSSLKFLRKTPWAREKVEQLYIYAILGDKLAAKKHGSNSDERRTEKVFNHDPKKVTKKPYQGNRNSSGHQAKPSTEKFVWPSIKKK